MHPIQLKCPKDPAEILSRLSAAGFAAYAVGGCVRDTLLGILPHDWDVTTSALPEQILAVFEDEHTIPTGLKHGTVTVMMHHVPYEVTTFRIDGAYTDSRHPESVTFSGRISDDLSRRDFTINALAWNERDGIVDCFNGMEDLKNRTIRAVGAPELRFREDALRILRGYRFAAQLDFEIEENTRNALISEAHLLKNISRERVSSEFTRLITAKGAKRVLKMLESDNILSYVYAAGTGLKLPPDEILDRIDALPATAEDRLGFLMRGAPSEHVRAELRTLRLSNKQYKDILALADEDGLTALPATEYETRKLLAAYGELSERALEIASLHGEDTQEKRAQAQEIRKRHDCLTIGELAIGGRDLTAIGIKGAEIGRVLAALLDTVLRDPSQNTPDLLLRAAKALHNSKTK